MTQGQSQQQPHRYRMGDRIKHAERQPFFLTEEHLAVHCCVLGQSGSGKSKFLEQLMRFLMASEKGFALIDPHGDLSEDLLAFAEYRRVVRHDTQLLNRIHYLEPSYEQVFHYDPFKFHPAQPIPDHLRADAYRAWLHAKADRIGEIVQRKQGQSDFQSMPRLQRVLTNLLIAVGTPVDDTGKHLPLADALVLLDLDHPRHDDIFRRVAPFLDRELLSEFDRFHRYRNPHQLLHEIESTINRLRSLLSPLVKSIFSEQVHTIDFRSIIQNREILLVNLRETDYFSADQASAIGGLFIHELLTTAQTTPREMRQQFYTIIDEAGEFIGADIQRALGVMRKFKMPLCLAAQDLSSFERGDLDLRPKVLSQCGTLISFRQSWPDDLDILSRVMTTGNLDFTELLHEVDRDDGYDFLTIEEYSRQFNSQENWSDAVGQSRTQTLSTGHTEGASWNDSESTGSARVIGSSDATSRNRNHIETSTNLSKQQSDSNTNSRTRGSGTSRSDSTSKSDAAGMSKTQTLGGSSGTGLTVSRRLMPLSRKRVEFQHTGQLRRSVSDQLAKMQQAFHALGVGQGIAKMRSENAAFLFETVSVDEKWSIGDKYEIIESVKQQLAGMRAYFSAAKMSPEDQEQRLSLFLEQATHGIERLESSQDTQKLDVGQVSPSEQPLPKRRSPFN